MTPGINHYLLLGTLILGMGIYMLVTHKNYFRLLAGLIFIFSAPVLNIAAFSGNSSNYTEGYLLIFLTSAVSFGIIAAGVLIYYRIQKDKDPVSEK